MQSAIASVPDGFLRLSLDIVLSTPLIHFVSGLDSRDGAIVEACGRTTRISGYTEWISVTTPRLSLGWDWRIETHTGELQCVRVGLPRSNVMLIDAARQDYGWERSLQILATIVDSIPWVDATRRMVSERYG